MSQSKTEVPFTPATTKGDRKPFLNHRRLANECWEKCREYEDLMERAKNEKDYSEFKKRREEMRERADQEDAVASWKIFNDKNERREDSITRDLHGQNPREAIRILRQHIATMGPSHKAVKKLVIVTGRGLHSKDGIPKVKEAVINFCEENGIRWIRVNEGRIAIELVDACNYKYSEVKDDKDDKGPGPVDVHRMEEVTPALNLARTKDLIIYPNLKVDYRCTNKCKPIDVVD